MCSCMQIRRFEIIDNNVHSFELFSFILSQAIDHRNNALQALKIKVSRTNSNDRLNDGKATTMSVQCPRTACCDKAIDPTNWLRLYDVQIVLNYIIKSHIEPHIARFYCHKRVCIFPIKLTNSSKLVTSCTVWFDIKMIGRTDFDQYNFIVPFKFFSTFKDAKSLPWFEFLFMNKELEFWAVFYPASVRTNLKF